MSTLLFSNNKKKNFVKDGLVLWLDGKDFTNSPPTSALNDKSGNNNIGYSNLATNGDMEINTGGTASGYASYGAGNNTFSADTTIFHSSTKSQKIVATSPWSQFGLAFVRQFIVGHKYYISYFSYIPSTNTGAITNDLFTDNISVSNKLSSNIINTKNQWNKQSGIVVALQSTGTIWLRATPTTAIGDTIYLDDFMIVDLTATFGSGNEPSQSWCDINLGFVLTNCAGNYRFNNLQINGNFAIDSNSDGIADGFSIYNPSMTDKLVINNEQVYTPTGQWGGIKTSYLAATGDKIYVGAKFKTDSGINKPITFSINRSPWSGDNPTLTNDYTLHSFIYVSTGVNDDIVIQDQATSGWVKTYVKEFCIYNLTQIFGAGNEPTLSWCNANMGFVASSGVAFKGNTATPYGIAYNTSSGSDANGGIALDGVDDYIQMPSNFLPTSLTSFTLETKFKMTSFNGSTSMGIIDNWNYPNTGFCIRYFSGQLHFTITNGSTYINCSIAIANDYNVSHIVATYDGSTMKLYKNGKIIMTNSYIGAIVYVNEQIRIGKCMTNLGYTNGTLYLTRIYNRALTDAEILQNYNANK